MELNNLIAKKLEADKAYYSTGHPVMSDPEYDTLIKEIEAIDPTHPVLEKVGAEPSSPWEKGEHQIPMGSLNNVFNEEELRKWATRFPAGTLFTIQYKLDGLSASLQYNVPELDKAITRGDGFTGDVITINALKMRNVPLNLEKFPKVEILSVRGEICLPKSDFDRINTTLPEKDQYKNPRNAAAGICRRLDGKFARYLIFIPYDIVTGGETEPDEDKKIELLRVLDFKAVNQTVGTLEEIIEAYKKAQKDREGLPIGIDGMVVKACSNEIQKEMGSSGNRPKAQIAWKFDPPGGITIFEKEEWDVGRTGVVTPLAHLKPVDIDGSTISKATLHNVAEIGRLGIGRGDTVLLIKGGDIIPKITQVIEPANPRIPIEIPTVCPSCSSKLSNDGITLRCDNDLCQRKNFNRILNWIKVLDIQEMGESLAGALKLQSIVDLYMITIEDICRQDGMGMKTAKKVLKNVKASQKQTLDKFLTALGIPGIGESTAKDLVKNFKTLKEILEASEEKVSDLKGYAETSSATIVNGLKKFSSEIKTLTKIIDVIEGDETGGHLAGKSFCFTGAMSKPRPQLQKLVDEHGGENKKSAVKTLSYLVCNEDQGTKKIQDARKNGTEIITEGQFLEMIGLTEVPDSEPEKSGSKVETVSLF